MSVGNIVTKLGESRYVITHGFGFINVDVIINAEPIRLNFSLSGNTIVVPGNIVHAEAIRLNFEITGIYLGEDIFILNLETYFHFSPNLSATINTQLSFLAPVEFEEEVYRVRIT